MSDRRPAPWLVATVLAVAVTTVVFSLPFVVHWAWPSLDSDVLMLGNFVLGGLLGVGAVIGFLHWKWEL
ncbi:hypothetical protein [Streptomyces achromogenes]|uniref:hypothetical protein n=1 Tax=Streptomyces achromogenes TaxID=67255 RepID=UPI003A7FD012